MFKKLLATPYALFMLLFVILPIVLIAVYAFTDAEGAIDLIGNFQDLAKEESLGKVVRNSVIAGLSTAVICLVIGYPIAYYLTKSEFNRTGVLIGLFLVPMWVNFLLRMMSTKAALNALHIEMGMGTVIFGLCYEFLPFMIMPIYTTIQKIDKSLIEGATDLGATPTKAFWKVTVPLSLPGVLCADSAIKGRGRCPRADRSRDQRPDGSGQKREEQLLRGNGHKDIPTAHPAGPRAESNGCPPACAPERLFRRQGPAFSPAVQKPPVRSGYTEKDSRCSLFWHCHSNMSRFVGPPGRSPEGPAARQPGSRTGGSRSSQENDRSKNYPPVSFFYS